MTGGNEFVPTLDGMSTYYTGFSLSCKIIIMRGRHNRDISFNWKFLKNYCHGVKN